MRTASAARTRRSSGTSPAMIGNPQSSRLISSGSISAHNPRPSQAIMFTSSAEVPATM
jgi:hypothetical protein